MLRVVPVVLAVWAVACSESGGRTGGGPVEELAACTQDRDCRITERCLGGFCGEPDTTAPGDAGECARDLDCTGGNVCLDTRCVPVCRGSGDCAAGLECAEDGRCVRPDPCRGVMCRAGTRCDPMSGACRAVGGNGGGNGAIGDACASDDDCSSVGAVCFEGVNPRTGDPVWPAGYCTIVGCTPGQDGSCPAGSSCYQFGSASGTACLADCDAEGVGGAGCRGGYVCQRLGASSPSGACIPRCHGDSDCASEACDAVSGLCRTDIGGSSGGGSSGNGHAEENGGGLRFPPGSPCYDIFDCVLFNQFCVQYAPDTQGVCLNPCLPGIGGCGAGEECAPLTSGDGACLGPATVPAGGACDGLVDVCANGLSCVRATPATIGGTCQAGCTPQPDTCPAGTSCQVAIDGVDTCLPHPNAREGDPCDGVSRRCIADLVCFFLEGNESSGVCELRCAGPDDASCPVGTWCRQISIGYICY